MLRLCPLVGRPLKIRSRLNLQWIFAHDGQYRASSFHMHHCRMFLILAWTDGMTSYTSRAVPLKHRLLISSSAWKLVDLHEWLRVPSDACLLHRNNAAQNVMHAHWEGCFSRHISIYEKAALEQRVYFLSPPHLYASDSFRSVELGSPQCRFCLIDLN